LGVVGGGGSASQGGYEGTIRHQKCKKKRTENDSEDGAPGEDLNLHSWGKKCARPMRGSAAAVALANRYAEEL